MALENGTAVESLSSLIIGFHLAQVRCDTDVHVYGCLKAHSVCIISLPSVLGVYI